MKKISEIINKPVGIEKVNNCTLADDAIDLVNTLFKIFDVHVSAFSYFAQDDEKLKFAKREWTRCFQKSSLSREQFEVGLNSVRSTGFKFMITPADFIALCKPKSHADTFDRSYMGIESDEHKRIKRQKGISYLTDIKNKLGM